MSSQMHVCSLQSSSLHDILYKYHQNFKRCSTFKYFFLKLILISEKNKRSRLFFRSNASIYFEMKRHIESKNVYIIHPFSIFRLGWECFMILVYIFCVTMVPLNVAHNMQDVGTQSRMTSTQQILLCIDILCLIDIVVHCLTGFENTTTREVYLSPKKIFSCYFNNGDFIIDLITSLPIQVLRYLRYIPTQYKLYIITFSLFKGLRSRTLFKYAKRFSANWHINTILFKLLLYILMSLFILHWAACIFLIIPKFINFLMPHYQSWLTQEKIHSNNTFEQYKVAVFVATASFLCVRHSVNSTKSLADTVILTVTYIFGYIMCILLFVNLLQLVLSLNTPATKYESIMNQLNQYMRHRQLPLNLQHRLVQYYGHRFRKTYFRESAIMPILSERLQLEINLHCYTTLVENVTILHELPDDVVSEIVSNLKSEVFLPNDIIIKAGTVGDSMYFISTGTVTVSTLTGREVCHLQDGAYFGEIALIRKDQKRIANVVAIEICEVYKLERKVFKSCLATQPDVYKKLEKIAQDRYNRTNFLEELHKKHILERSLARKHDMAD